jgi:hypothetical protein
MNEKIRTFTTSTDSQGGWQFHEIEIDQDKIIFLDLVKDGLNDPIITRGVDEGWISIIGD